jgi:ribose transport system permease protein
MKDVTATTKPKKKISIPQELTIFIVLIVLVAVFGIITDGRFLKSSNIANLFKQTAINGVIAIGMTVVIISGGIDLSVGSTVGFSGIFAAVLMSRYGWGIPQTMIVTVLVCAAMGILNGVMIYDGKVPPFIATLGTMTMTRGAIMLVSDARMIAGLPDSFVDFAQADVSGIPTLAIAWIAILIVAFILLKYSVFGRNVYAIGSNEEASRLSGINIRLNIYGIYLFSALCSCIAGMMMTARLGNGVPTGGQGYEMNAIAAAVVGGASLSGGEGSIIGTVIGALIMQALQNGGNLLGANSFILQICIGAMIIIAVLVDRARKK